MPILKCGRLLSRGCRATMRTWTSSANGTNLHGSIYLRRQQDSVLRALPDGHGLTHLFAGSFVLEEKHLEYLQRLPKLRYFSAGDSPITHVGLEHIGKAKSLVELHLDRTPVSDKGLPNLYSLNNLRTLSLNDTNITKVGLRKLKLALPDCQINTQHKDTVVEAFEISTGFFRRYEGDEKSWVETSRTHNDLLIFSETSRNQDYIGIRDASRNLDIRFPLNGGMSSMSTDGGKTWSEWHVAKKIPQPDFDAELKSGSN